MSTAAMTSPRTILAAAFLTGVAVAAAQLEGPANDAPGLDRQRDPFNDTARTIGITRSRALPESAILDALDGACEAVSAYGRRGTLVTVYAWEALAGAYAATDTHRGSRAGRAAVACIAATLRAHGIDAL